MRLRPAQARVGEAREATRAVALAFAPQGNSIGRWMKAARQKGHELLMQAPLEPFDYPNVNPGRNTLTVDATPRENIHRLHWTLSRTTNYTTVMNYMGALFSANREAMEPVMENLKISHSEVFDIEFVDVWLPENQTFAKSYSTSSIPTQVFLNAAGKEIARNTGFFSEESILAKWRELGVDVDANKTDTPAEN